MAALLGKIDSFDPELEDWPEYVERLEQFFEANGIVGEDNEARQRSVFISVVGPTPYKLLRSLIAPEKPKGQDLCPVVLSATETLQPRAIRGHAEIWFNTRGRKSGESVAAYVAELRRLAQFCNFGTTLEKMICDRLMCGINDEGIQKRLLAERGLTYEKALTVAQGAEAAYQNLRELNCESQLGAVVIKKEPVNQGWTGYEGNVRC